MIEAGPGGPSPENDNGPRGNEPPFAADMLMALRFFSRLPTGDLPHRRPDLNRIAPLLPLVSVLIGAAPAAVLLLLAWAGAPLLFAAVAAVAVQIVVTGAMSEDALADAADGLFGGQTPERRLEIMKDSRHGTYGVCAIALLIAFRVTAFGSTPSALEAAGLVIATGAMARSGALWLAVALPAARSGGASASAGSVSIRNFAIGAGLVAVLAFVFAGFATSILGLLVAAAACAAVAAGWVVLCRRLVGGQTGDLIGALQALLEIAALTAFMVFV